MADGEIIPLVEDYDFSDWTDERIDMELEITKEIKDQIERMITENQRLLDLGNDVIGRTKMATLLEFERNVRIDKFNALTIEKDNRLGG